MSQQYQPKGIRPNPVNVAYVRSLIERLGPVAAAKRLRLSRNAVVSYAGGFHCHVSTDTHITDARLEDEATRAA